MMFSDSQTRTRSGTARRCTRRRVRIVATAASPRLVSTEYPRCGRGGAATRPRNVFRRRRRGVDPAPRPSRVTRAGNGLRRGPGSPATNIYRTSASGRRATARSCSASTTSTKLWFTTSRSTSGAWRSRYIITHGARAMNRRRGRVVHAGRRDSPRRRGRVARRIAAADASFTPDDGSRRRRGRVARRL